MATRFYTYKDLQGIIYGGYDFLGSSDTSTVNNKGIIPIANIIHMGWWPDHPRQKRTFSRPTDDHSWMLSSILSLRSSIIHPYARWSVIEIDDPLVSLISQCQPSITIMNLHKCLYVYNLFACSRVVSWSGLFDFGLFRLFEPKLNNISYNLLWFSIFDFFQKKHQPPPHPKGSASELFWVGPGMKDW